MRALLAFKQEEEDGVESTSPCREDIRESLREFHDKLLEVSFLGSFVPFINVYRFLMEDFTDMVDNKVIFMSYT